MRRPAALISLSWSVLLVASELSSSLVGPLPGAVFDTALAALLLIWAERRTAAADSWLLTVLALVTLVPPISLVAVVPKLPALTRCTTAGLPLLVGALLAASSMDRPARDLRLRAGQPRLDVVLVPFGLCAGVVGHLTGIPDTLGHPTGIVGIVATVGTLVVFGGLLEELLFRGLLQDALSRALGGAGRGVALMALVSASLYWGVGSIAYTALMAALAVVFGISLLRGASLWGVAASHALMLITVGLLAS